VARDWRRSVRAARRPIKEGVPGSRDAITPYNGSPRPLCSVPGREDAVAALTARNRELALLADRLSQIHDFREQLLGELSHDLRAPLQSALVRAQRLQHALDGEARREAQGIELAVLDALEQVEDVLEQVRRDHGEARLALADADLAEALAEVVAQFQPLAEAHGVRLRSEAPEALPARFDVERVSRIASNLLANALRFTPRGGIVRCRLAAEGELARLEVADSGSGVPPERRDVLFARFATGGRRGTGTGLGLAIVREFAVLHGGEVAVGDAPEGGACFTVTLPLRPADGPVAPATLRQQLAAARRIEYVRASLAAELSEEPEPPGVATVAPPGVPAQRPTRR
jgi:signal transduction histidine kinase